MGRRYTYAFDVGATGVEVEVSYAVVWGTPERGNFGPPERYDPGSPDIIEDVRAERLNGRPRPWVDDPYFDAVLAAGIEILAETIADQLITHAYDLEAL